jgi:hypothetical protein
MEDNFYINLPSNVITHKYSSENLISNFTTKLPAHVSLDGRWEVGLVEMSYTKSWYNVPEKQLVELWFYEDKGYGLEIVTKNGFLDKGNYNTIDELATAINTAVLNIEKTSNESERIPQIQVNSKTRIVSMNNGIRKNRRIFMLPSIDLCQMLGFDYYKMSQFYTDVLVFYKFVENNQAIDEANNAKLAMLLDGDVNDESNANANDNIFADKSKTDMFSDDQISKKIPNTKLIRLNNKLNSFTGDHPYDLSGGFHSLFVYCNIVKPSYVGNTYTQLLRLVEIPSDKKFGDQVLIAYPNTYYIPLLTQEFETIEIDIKAETGETVPFEFGRSILTLHFRRVKLI